MKTTMLKLLLLFAAALVLAQGQACEAAPIGTAFTYQGHLYDANYPANSLYDFQFKLFDDPCTGTQQGSTVYLDEVDIIDGYFTVELDFGDVFDGNECWLKIGIRPGELEDPNEYTTLEPRQEVTPAPHAIYANSSNWNNLFDVPTDIADGDDVGITSETDPTVLASVKDGISWTEVSDRPTGLDDGDDVGITSETDPCVPTNLKDGVSWTEVADIPSDIADGDDNTQLSEAQVDSYVANNGYVSSWGDIPDIPADIADGDDDTDTQLSEAQVDAYVANNGYLDTETDPTVVASVKDGISWTEVSERPAGLDDGDDVGITSETDPQVGGNVTNYIPKWSGEELVSGTIYDNGNVGIGTTEPGSYKLNVNGNMYATAYYGSGANLTGITVPDNSISQAKLKTAVGEVSTSSNNVNLTLPWGTYGFHPQVKVSPADHIEINFSTNNPNLSTSYVTQVGIEGNAYNSAVYIQQRYVTASGTDHWLFLLVDKETKDIISAYSAPDHPAYGNGGDFDKAPHPFGSYDETRYEIVLLDKETCLALKQESEQTGKSILTLVNEEYEPKMDNEEVYQPLHSGKFLTENGEQVKQMVQSIPSYIKVRKLEKLTEQDKQNREIIRQQKIQQAEQDKQKKEQDRQRAINKLKALGLDEAELFALIGK